MFVYRVACKKLALQRSQLVTSNPIHPYPNPNTPNTLPSTVSKLPMCGHMQTHTHTHIRAHTHTRMHIRIQFTHTQVTDTEITQQSHPSLPQAAPCPRTSTAKPVTQWGTTNTRPTKLENKNAYSIEKMAAIAWHTCVGTHMLCVGSDASAFVGSNACANTAPPLAKAVVPSITRYRNH